MVSGTTTMPGTLTGCAGDWNAGSGVYAAGSEQKIKSVKNYQEQELR